MFSLFHMLLHPILAWNVAKTVFFYILSFFTIFLILCITRRVGTKRNDNFYFHSISAFYKPILSWNDAIMVFFNFLNFLAIFMEFSITRRVGTKRNDDFCFPLSRPIPTYYGLKWSHNGIFLIFLNFFLFFGIFI